jgi:general stress protein 26
MATPESTMQRNEITDEEARQRVRDIIDDVKVAMFTTCDTSGAMRSRPMYTQRTEVNGDLWFTTSRASGLVADVEQQPMVLVTYGNPSAQRFVTIDGSAVVSRDQSKIDELWNPTLKMWFEGGPTDPDLVLVHVQSHRASYWDSPIAPVRWLQFVAGLATGTPPAGDLHGEVAL